MLGGGARFGQSVARYRTMQLCAHVSTRGNAIRGQLRRSGSPKPLSRSRTPRLTERQGEDGVAGIAGEGRGSLGASLQAARVSSRARSAQVCGAALGRSSGGLSGGRSRCRLERGRLARLPRLRWREPSEPSSEWSSSSVWPVRVQERCTECGCWPERRYGKCELSNGK